MDYVPEIFQQAPIGEISQSACSPEMDVVFMGVAIAAPQKITLEGAPVAVVPLCVSFQLPANKTMNADPIIIHARRQTDSVTVSGALGMDPDAPDEPEVPEPEDAGQPSAAALANTLSVGWFHLDAQQWLDIELTEGSFEFFVTYAGEESEKRVIEIMP